MKNASSCATYFCAMGTKKINGISQEGERRNMEVMADKQYDGILQMIGMILDGCKDLNEAKRKIEALREGKKEETE